MKNIKVNRKNLLYLLNNLRSEDKEEIVSCYKNNYKEKFIKASIKAGEKYFLSDSFGFPLIIGGVEEVFLGSQRAGQVWLISSNKFKENRIELMKFIKQRIDDFKASYDILFNVIYKSNFPALKWLKGCGFKVLDINNTDYKLFYFTKGGTNFDLRYIACEQL